MRRSPHEEKQQDYEHQTRVDHVHHPRQPKDKAVTRQKKALRRNLRHVEHELLATQAHHVQSKVLGDQVLNDPLIEQDLWVVEQEVKTKATKIRKKAISKEKRIPLGEWVKAQDV